MSDYGYHWTPCRRGGGAALVVFLIVVFIVARDGRAIGNALAMLLEIALVTAAVLLAAAGVTVALVVRSRRRRRAGRSLPIVARVSVVQVGQRPAKAVSSRQSAAIDPPRSNTSTYPRIDAKPHAVTGRAARPRCSRRPDRRS